MDEGGATALGACLTPWGQGMVGEGRGLNERRSHTHGAMVVFWGGAMLLGVGLSSLGAWLHQDPTLPQADWGRWLRGGAKP